jgi:hypothetical protein
MAVASLPLALRSYRLAWRIWIAWSLVYAAIYLRVAVIGSHYPEASIFAGTILLQALVIPSYISQERFAGPAAAAIQSACSAVALVALTAITQVSARISFQHFTFLRSTDTLHFPFVATILLLSGAVGGTALGILRWRVLQAAPAQPIGESSDSKWHRYFQSAVVWIASVTIYSWPIRAIGGEQNRERALLAEIALVGAGLLFVAPLALRSSLWEIESDAQRTWKCFKSALLPVTIATLILSPVVGGIWALYVLLPYFVILAMPCLLWAILYSRCVRPLSDRRRPDPWQSLSLHPKAERLSNGVVVGLSAFAQLFALLGGLLAAAPMEVGLHGAGCVNAYHIQAAEYWFWKGYKGLNSDVESDKQIVVRTPVDPSLCMVLNEKAMTAITDPVQLSNGYVAAARSWSWLIDPEQWESDRTKRIRVELRRLLGKDFSSYEELAIWWDKNGRYLVWSSEDQLLRVREPDLQTLANPGVDQLSQQAPPVVLTESERQDPWLFGPLPLGSGPTYPGFRSQAFDREARFRALTLYVADNIQILTGERPRRVQDFLRRFTGQNFSTEAEWNQFFAQVPRPNPWRISREGAQNLVSLIRQHGGDPNYESPSSLRMETAQNYSSLDEFVPWLENPDNTRREEWEIAGRQIKDAYEGQDFNSPLSHKRSAMGWLKDTTDQTYDIPEQWVRWWQENRSNFTLSEDGQRLISKRTGRLP